MMHCRSGASRWRFGTEKGEADKRFLMDILLCITCQHNTLFSTPHESVATAAVENNSRRRRRRHHASQAPSMAFESPASLQLSTHPLVNGKTSQLVELLSACG